LFSFPFLHLLAIEDSERDTLSRRRRGVEAALCVDERGLGNLLAQDVALDEVGQPDFGLVLEVDGCGDGEDFCLDVSEYMNL
jgi:hypothetical protein